jgi:hypothetical protein
MSFYIRGVAISPPLNAARVSMVLVSFASDVSYYVNPATATVDTPVINIKVQSPLIICLAKIQSSLVYLFQNESIIKREEI